MEEAWTLFRQEETLSGVQRKRNPTVKTPRAAFMKSIKGGWRAKEIALLLCEGEKKTMNTDSIKLLQRCLAMIVSFCDDKLCPKGKGSGFERR